MNYNIALISGDGIGPEIVAEAKKVLDKVCEVYGHTISYYEVFLGGASFVAHGVPLTEEAIADAKASDAVLMGSIGGDAKTSPWYKLEPSKRPEAGLLAIRKALNLFANLRPAYLYNELLPKEADITQLADKLPDFIFAYHIVCHTDKKIVRVAVVHDEGGGEQNYRMQDGGAVVHIATPNYRIDFVDDNGYYHAGTVDYEIKKLCRLDEFAEMCYQYGADSLLVKLHLFAKILAENVEISTKEAILIHELVRSDVLGVEYQHKGLLILYDYYKSIGEDALLEEVIRDIDFHYISRERQAGILQTMIQFQMNEDALGVFRKYE